jgi:uncharacterized protein (UPF0548 family)
MPVSVRLAGLDVTLGGPPRAADISRLFSEPAASARLPSLGVLRPGPPPAGYRVQELERVVGSGKDAWRRSSRALETADALDLSWARFWSAGKRGKSVAGDPVVIGARVLVPGLWVSNVNHLVDLSRSRSRVSMAWRTTTRHALSGEEVLKVERRNSGDVVFSLKSYSRPRSLVAWLTYPYVIFLQRKFALGVAHRLEQIARSEDALAERR